MQAGAHALEFNAPLGATRADAIVATLQSSSGAVVDLGCGRGSLLHRFAAAAPERLAVGVDSDADSIALAQAQPTTSDHLTFEVADATTWTGPDDIGAVIAVGVSHVFDGPTGQFQHVAAMCPDGVSVVGDGVWQANPDSWCRETFGDLPNGVDQLAELARAAGWKVTDAAVSTVDEWDDFEHGWIAGVRAIDTDEANTFADERAAEYERYRGVLGFGWLMLRSD